MRPEKANTAHIAYNDECAAYWAFRGWVAARGLHYTEVWAYDYPEQFLEMWNSQMVKG